MKLVIAAEIFPPDIGGPATYSELLAGELSRLGWQVKVVCYSNRDGGKTYPFEVFRIVRSASVWQRYWRYFFKLLQIAKDCDLIYAQGPVGSGLPASLAARWLKKKLVVKVTGDYAWEQARVGKSTKLGIDEFQYAKPKGKIRLLKAAERFSCRQALQVITPSQYLKKIVIGWGISPEKIKVIYNSFDAAKVEAVRNKNQIISVGRLVPWKGFDLLIEVFAQLAKDRPDLRLLIAGDGPQKEQLQEKIRELGLQDKAEIKSLAHSEVIKALSESGTFVLNTGYEGLSHTLLEAMAAEVPIVTTAVGGNPELIKNGENGLLVEYNNQAQLKEAILKVLSQPEAAGKFTENSAAILKKFSREAMLEKTVEDLKSLAQA